MSSRHITLVFAALLLLLAVPAFAELNEFESGVSSGGKAMSFGLGVAAVPDYEGSDDYTAAPLVIFQSRFQSGRFIDLMGNRLKVNLLPSNTYSLGPVVQYRAKRDDGVEDEQVSRMKEIDAAIEAGLFAGININNWLAGVQVTTDVSDTHDGTLATVNGGYILNINPSLTLVPSLSATWASDDYMDTYFSVNAANRGTSTLPNFVAEGGFKDVALAVIFDFHPWQNWKIIGGAAYRSLLGDAKDSPVVDLQGDSNQLIAGVALAYQWVSR